MLTGCASPLVIDLEPDATRTGEGGLDGPYGVAHQSFRVSARGTDLVHYEMLWPADPDGAFSAEVETCPLVMFIHGGLVEPDQYRWLGIHFASRGYCVAMPEHDFQLAIFESDNSSIVLDDLEERPRGAFEGRLEDRRAIMGHSLGGAVASLRWVDDPRFEALGLLASWPSDDTDIEGQDRPSISIIGSVDDRGNAPPKAFEQYQRFPEPSWFGVVDGMNHYDWVDGASDRELAGDGVPTRPRKETRQDVQRVLDAWLDATLRDDAAAQTALDDRLFPNIAEEP